MKRIISLLLFAVICLSSCALRPSGAIPETDKGPETVPVIDNDTQKPETDAPETEAKKEDTVYKASFLGCGDNIIYYGTWRDAQANAGGAGYDFKPMYKNVADAISAADIAFINQECVIADSKAPISYPTFNAPVQIADDLISIGFDVVSVANNHMLDQGPSGLAETYENWKERNVTLIGCHEENDSGKYITYTEKNGIQIAYVSYTYGTNLGGDPADHGLYASYLKYADIEGEIKEARDNSEFVVVSVHWGDEGSTTPNEEQKKYARLMADSGADVIIGHHPHVIQPIEWITGKDGNKTLCVYSLGNFLHEQDRQYNVPGGMIQFDIVKINDQRAKVENPVFVPTVCHYPSNFYGNVIYYMKDYSEELASKHAVRTYYKNTISYEYMVNLVKTTIGAEFLPDYMK